MVTERVGTDTGWDPAVGADESAQRLRAAVLALRQPQAAKRAPAPRSSVYGRAAAAVPDDVHAPSTTVQLAARFRNAETTALMAGTSLCLVVLPTPGPPPPELARSLALLASGSAVVVVLGPSVPRDVPADRSRPLLVPLRADDSLAGEWALVACGPAKRVAFLARAEAEDSWSWLLTRDTIAVQRAATALLERVPFLRLRVPPLVS
ncbi:MAG: hypothetical protein JWN17_782 [Frankiales bacterium]|nr:hypothetical protein [Frankiales bacterium]